MAFSMHKLYTLYGIILIHLDISEHLDTIRFERIGSYFKNKRKQQRPKKQTEEKTLKVESFEKAFFNTHKTVAW